MLPQNNNVTGRQSIKRLPNDSCLITKTLELKFLNETNLTAYEQNNGSNGGGGDDGNNGSDNLGSGGGSSDGKDTDINYETILYCRTADTHYSWPSSKPLSSKDLKMFEEVGHTFGFDYRLMYTRKLAFDLDCICRKNPRTSSHLNEGLVNKVIQSITLHLQQQLNEKITPEYSIWRNKCGYHIYSNINVSLPTHLLLAKYVSIDFQVEDVIIEVPDIMPLPYSAKKTNEPYIPMYPNQTEVILNMNIKESYYECFDHIQVFQKSASFVKMKTRTSTLYCNRSPNVRQKYGSPKINHIRSIELFPEFDYMIQYVKYIEHVNAKETENLLNNGTRELNGISHIRDAKLKDRLFTFLSVFNEKFTGAALLSTEMFINFAFISNGGLYLQHCVVLMHKFLDPVSDEDMTMILKIIFKKYIDSEARPKDLCIERFIKYYDSNTYRCYTDSKECMLEHLHFLYVNEISPFDSLDDQIDKMMRQILCEESNIAFQRSIRMMPKEERVANILRAISVYCELMIAMNAIMYNVSTLNYYILDGASTHYKISTKLDYLPQIIFYWVGTSKKTKEYIMAELDMQRRKYTVRQTTLLTKCKFQFSTSVGVFNSIIGMYTAKTRFLRFICYRESAVWDFDSPYVMHAEQNYGVVKKLEKAEKYAKFINYNVEPLFVHFLLAPAIIHIRKNYNLNEYMIKNLLNILTLYKDLSSAYFLVEYYPIDPKFIYVIMYIYKNYDGFHTLENYLKLSDHIFNHNRVDENAWREKFRPLLDKCTYQQKDTHMETLLTIDGDSVNNVTEEFCFYATILAICFIKCKSFDTFTKAFDVTKLPEPRNEHPEYNDFNWDISLSMFQSNLYRALRIVFGNCEDTFDRKMILAISSICMSTYFNPTTTQELLNSLASLFVPINLARKIFLYYGKGGVGKSMMCDIIQYMASPKVGRFQNLNIAMDRANITAKTNVTILNEMKYVDSGKIKAITGNDAESAVQFYNQEYEMHMTQSLIYGATNHIISFTGKSDVDPVSVDRLHVIQLIGTQNPIDFKSATLLSMLTNYQMFQGIVTLSEYEIATAITWLSYGTYVISRNENFLPKINLDNSVSREYREIVYRMNNSLYNFLVNADIIEARGFHISTNKFISIVKNRLRNINCVGSASSSVSTIKNYVEFKMKFYNQYCIDIEKTTIIQDFQEIGLVDHIMRNMCVYECEGEIITGSDIEERVRVYSDSIDKENARSYFMRENGNRYCYISETYKNIAFKSQPIYYDNNKDLFTSSPPSLSSSSSSSMTALAVASTSSSQSMIPDTSMAATAAAAAAPQETTSTMAANNNNTFSHFLNSGNGNKPTVDSFV
jgi:hypothetical protein